MEYLIDNKGSVRSIKFSVDGTEYKVIETDGSKSRSVWDAFHTVKNMRTKERRTFTAYEMRKWVVELNNQ